MPDCAAPVVEAPRFDALKVDKLLCISVTSTTLPRRAVLESLTASGALPKPIWRIL